MRIAFGLAASFVLMVASAPSIAQLANKDLANQIIAARQKNAALMKTYNWQCRTEVIVDGDVRDTRVDSVRYGPDGKLQRTETSNQAAPMPRGFLARRMAEDKRKEIEALLKGIHEQIDQYTLSSSGAAVNFLTQAKINNMQAPDGSSLLQVTGNSAANPGDTISLTFDPATHQARHVEIGGSSEGHPFKVEGSFKSLKSGLTYMQFATIDVPDEKLSLQIHNFDYAVNE